MKMPGILLGLEYNINMKGTRYTFKGGILLFQKFFLPSSEKGTLEEKNLLPVGENSYLLGVDPFSEGAWCSVKHTGGQNSFLWQESQNIYHLVTVSAPPLPAPTPPPHPFKHLERYMSVSPQFNIQPTLIRDISR